MVITITTSILITAVVFYLATGVVLATYSDYAGKGESTQGIRIAAAISTTLLWPLFVIIVVLRLIFFPLIKKITTSRAAVPAGHDHTL